jgi:uncharacterized RDD family membrane protein YckC
MFCPKCGKAQVDNPRFCPNCGTVLVQEPSIQPGVAYASAIEYAGFWRRFGAWFLDIILLYAVEFVVGLIIGFVLGAAGADIVAIEAIAYLVGLIISVCYYALMESSSKQATLGKMALRIIVTDRDGRRISFGRAVGRYFAKIISGLILCIGFLMIAFTQKKQGLHDMIADTLVVLK